MYDVYKIKSGDTLEELANRFHTEIEKIMEINNLGNRAVRVGEELLIPDNQKQYFEYYTINRGDTLYGISRRYNINPELLASLNGLNSADYIYPNQVIMIPKANYSYYITKAGDTIDSVGNTFGITKDKLLNENKIIYLMEGQLLVNERS